jgi:hypothetical protein
MGELKDMSGFVPKSPTVESAIDAESRMNNCSIEINKALKKWNCFINPVTQITMSGVSTGWTVLPLDKKIISPA